MNSFLTRLTSGIILVALIFGTCWFGGFPLWLFVIMIGYLGLYEFYKVIGIELESSLGICCALGTALWFTGIRTAASIDSMLRMEQVWLILLLIFLIILAVYVFSFPKYNTQQIMGAFFGIIYVPVMLSCIYLTRMMDDGFHFVWLIFFCSWGCDTCAYCVGVLFGKHKMAPVLSPKKSIEGAIGGVAGAAILGTLFAIFTDASVGFYAVLCGVGAIISQIGDLAASAVKRQHQIKDYGKLIPGHGGILDRFDSVIVTAPMIYILLQFLAEYF